MTRPLPSSDQLSELPVGTIVARWPITAQVFERHQLDYCCQGQAKLGPACDQKGIDTAQLVAELQSLGTENAIEENWLERPLGELCDHIERQHHDYLRSELPRLADLIDKVINAHGQQHPELESVRRHFHGLKAELEPHMMKEERVLFPAIRQMEQTQAAGEFPFGSVANPIQCMEQEHEHAGAELGHLRELTSDYQPPAGACPTWRVMLDGLARLEHDMHTHVHKENSILFPRAAALEKSVAAS